MQLWRALVAEVTRLGEWATKRLSLGSHTSVIGLLIGLLNVGSQHLPPLHQRHFGPDCRRRGSGRGCVRHTLPQPSVSADSSLAGVDTERHSATISRGTKGVFHGVRTYILQTKVGQILGTHSISAGLDYPGVGPEHAWLHETKRGEYISATDEEALRGFRACTQMEGIIPALETSHAVWATMQLAKTMPKEANIVMVRQRLALLPAPGGRSYSPASHFERECR